MRIRGLAEDLRDGDKQGVKSTFDSLDKQGVKSTFDSL